MTRPGWLVHAEQDARDEAERHGWDLDYLPDRDDYDGLGGPPGPHRCDGCPACRAIQRDRDRRTA